MLNGMTPMFSLAALSQSVDRFIGEVDDQQFMALSRIGEEFVNAARGKTSKDGSFRDQTGNLRASIGYVIVRNGKAEKTVVPGNKPVGNATAKAFAEEMAAKYPNGLVLVVFAGMEYAAAVESRGYDVITGSIPLKQEVESLLKEWIDIK